MFFEDVDMTNVKGHRLGTTPPWLVALPEVDRSLTAYYLHKIALHDTGTCDSCGQAESIKHYLINCSQNEIAAAVKNICDQRKISFTLPTVLSQVAVLEELHRLTHRQL